MNPNNLGFLRTGVLAGFALIASVATAQTFVFTDFSSSSGLTLNGSATTTTGAVPSDGTVLRLTPATFSQAGSAFSTTLVPLTDASFSTAFTFRISSSGGIGDSDGAGADGLTFLVQTVANNVGSIGGGIGYAGVAPSLAIEFDTYNNGYIDDYNGNHVGLNFHGNLDSVLLVPMGIKMNNDQLWYTWIDYNGSTDNLQVRLAPVSTRPAAPLFQANGIDLVSLLGQSSAYVGFTSGTGGGFGNHDIVSWQFNNEYRPIDGVGDGGSVPDGASTGVLLGTTLLAFAVVAKRLRTRQLG